MKYRGEQSFGHGEIPGVGVLLTNLGTPDAPDTPSLRRYLREFLLDPRVIELPRLLWWTILHLFVLTSRPAKSAALYRKVWTPQGSPLLDILQRQTRGIDELLRLAVASPLHVELGMRYGQPSIGAGLRSLAARGCRRILIFPLYPQYSGPTVGSTFDAVAAELTTWRWVPEVRTIHQYHDDPSYIGALAASIRELWEKDGEPDKLLFSFHGIPLGYFQAGDPYFCQCQKLARLTAEALAIPRERWDLSFQSRFGREEWLKPYTDKVVAALPKAGFRKVDLISPGFSADCLETLEELDEQNREFFLHAGGERFRYIPALNDRPDHLRALAGILLSNLAGWVTPPGTADPGEGQRLAEASAAQAAALKAQPVREDAGYG
jgi:ferrochelatase